MTVEVVYVRTNLEAFGGRQAGRIDAGAGDDDHSQRGQLPLGQRKCLDDPTQQVPHRRHYRRQSPRHTCSSGW